MRGLALQTPMRPGSGTLCEARTKKPGAGPGFPVSSASAGLADD